jgi:sialate O-acetylesterase
MVVTLDIGDPNDVHPLDKQEVGRRLALAARALTYGESSVVWSGPRLRRVWIEGSEARVQFTSAEGLRARDGRPVSGFQLAGTEGRFVKARAQLAADEALLTSAEVPAPCAVRYAWADNPDGNLENAAGLPAAPFRTDAGASE